MRSSRQAGFGAIALTALAAALSLAAPASSAPPSQSKAPPPWASGKAPTPDPLQAQLEARLKDWAANGKKQAADLDCKSATSAAQAAYAADNQLNHSYEAMHGAYAAMSQIQKADMAELGTRTIALAAQVVSFVAGAPKAEDILAHQSTALAVSGSQALSAFETAVSGYLGALYSGQPLTSDDGDIALAFTQMTAFAAGLGSSSPLAQALGSQSVGRLLGLIGIAKSVYDIVQLVSVQEAHLAGPEQTYRDAASLYDMALNRLEKQITAMNGALADCVKKAKEKRQCAHLHKSGHHYCAPGNKPPNP
jgi:hypothetical protein